MISSRFAEPYGMRIRREPPPALVQPDLWIVALRIVVGFWFVKSLWTKVGIAWVGGFLPLPVASERWVNFMPRRIAEWAETNPIGLQRVFLQEVVLPNAEVFAYLTLFGEVAVGIGLTLGLLTGVASLGGLFLVGNYYLASAGVPFNQQGFHILLIACLLAFLVTRAGRVFGVDGWLLWNHPERARKLPLM